MLPTAISLSIVDGVNDPARLAPTRNVVATMFARTKTRKRSADIAFDQWDLQGLHRFYQRRANEVVASYMTRQDRELAIADNIAYAASVVDAVAAEWPASGPLVFTDSRKASR